MGRPGTNHDIILFCSDSSATSHRIEYYLDLRGFKYSRCIQSPHSPKTDISALGVVHHRMPVLAIGRDIYTDTRIMIEKLESIFPCNTLSSREPFNRGIEKIIETWILEAGPWSKTKAAIPFNSSVLQDKGRIEGRKQKGMNTRRQNQVQELQQNQASVLVDLNSYFYWAEHGLLADGRKFLFNTDEPTLGDVHGVWSYDWALQTAMGDDADGSCGEGVINSWRFPKVDAWVGRFKQAHAKALDMHGQPEIVTGDAARKRILCSNFAELEGNVDLCDPAKLVKGEVVEIYPMDSGSKHADRGRLVSLCSREVVIAIKVKDGDDELRLHFPRTGFRIKPIDETESFLLKCTQAFKSLTCGFV